MSQAEWVVVALVALAAVYVLARLFSGPLRWLSTWVVRSILGAALLWVLQWPTALLGWHVGVNAWTALTVGALGLPGVALLYGAQFILR